MMSLKKINIITIICYIFNIVVIHLLIQQEELHLEEIFGKEYIEYKRATPRYFWIHTKPDKGMDRDLSDKKYYEIIKWYGIIFQGDIPK